MESDSPNFGRSLTMELIFCQKKRWRKKIEQQSLIPSNAVGGGERDSNVLSRTISISRKSNIPLKTMGDRAVAPRIIVGQSLGQASTWGTVGQEKQLKKTKEGSHYRRRRAQIRGSGDENDSENCKKEKTWFCRRDWGGKKWCKKLTRSRRK